MNIYINKFATGGGIPPVAEYTPVPVNTAVPATPEVAQSSAAESDDTKGKITDKDLLTMLKDIDGLPSDMESLYSEISKFYQLGDLSSSTSPSSLNIKYTRAIQQIKTAKFFKDAFEKAYTKVESNGGLNEIALSTSGNLIVLTKDGDIVQKSEQEIKKTPENYKVLTNGELLRYRAENINFAGDNELIQIASNGIGMDKVSSLILDNFKSIGENLISREGYIQGSNSEGIALIQELMKEDKLAAGTDIEGLYKAKVINKEQKSKINGALTYILNMLPDNAKHLLTIKAGGAENAKNLVYDMLASTTSSTEDISLDYIADKNNKKPGEKDSSDSDNSEKADLLTNIIQGIGGSYNTIMMKDTNGNMLNITGKNYGSLSIDPSKPLHEGTLQDLMDYGYASITKGGEYAITFGDTAVDNAMMKNITFLNDQQTNRVILPITRNQSGQIVPDYRFMEKNKNVISLINAKDGNLNDPEVKASLVKAGIIDPNTGLPDLSRFQSYLCVNGLGTSQDLPDGGRYEELTDTELEKYLPQFKNDTYKTKGENGGEERKFDFDENSWAPFDWFGNYDKLYKGTIFIPLTENSIQGKIGSGTSIKVSAQDQLEKQYQIGDAMRTAHVQNTSSSVLF